jgi:hypothetical protein
MMTLPAKKARGWTTGVPDIIVNYGQESRSLANSGQGKIGTAGDS